jgi:hypothetical protein
LLAEQKPGGDPKQDEPTQVEGRAIHRGNHHRQEQEDEPDLEEVEVPLPDSGKFGHHPRSPDATDGRVGIT